MLEQGTPDANSKRLGTDTSIGSALVAAIFSKGKKNDGDAVANKEKTREEIEAEARHFERVKKARGLL